ncbi:hypothetical protein VIGAN_01345200 [Vigna angularis var. angularis]|uniref:Uncharacterized protein n=1 Tax=Vigna angularis var. angularis TaxID=157739 RepID=A0A0S3R4T3_PHAAN|nr:hypothetical protein VIGAN_01345200 [Vigna angularis var. angularis]
MRITRQRATHPNHSHNAQTRYANVQIESNLSGHSHSAPIRCVNALGREQLAIATHYAKLFAQQVVGDTGSLWFQKAKIGLEACSPPLLQYFSPASPWVKPCCPLPPPSPSPNNALFPPPLAAEVPHTFTMPETPVMLDDPPSFIMLTTPAESLPPPKLSEDPPDVSLQPPNNKLITAF